jgi:cyclopropane-fatty-acyl-phospholipid synthase
MSLRASRLWERQLIRRLWESIGKPAVQIELWDGDVCGSSAAQAVGRITLREPKMLRRLMWNPSLAFGEGYTTGRIEVDGPLIDVIAALSSALWRAGDRGLTRKTWSDRLIRRRGHSLNESRDSVQHHYDLGNDFYRLWLDEQLVYTCAYYSEPGISLEQAQIAKFDHICRKLRLQPGDRVVEAGCGWGAFALHMARHYGARVRACNLSKEQLSYARHRARQEALDGQVEFVEADYRQLDGQYDVFVSVGMLEHVGIAQYPALGAVIDRLLTDRGRGLIHTIGRNFARPLDSWTIRYIFPGAEPPSLKQMMDIFEPNGLSVLDVENLRLHYADTCRAWLDRFEARVDEVARMFDEQFVRMWRFYLAASTASFLTGWLQLFQVQFARALDNSIPRTRADIYTSADRRSLHETLAASGEN